MLFNGEEVLITEEFRVTLKGDELGVTDKWAVVSSKFRIMIVFFSTFSVEYYKIKFWPFP